MKKVLLVAILVLGLLAGAAMAVEKAKPNVKTMMFEVSCGEKLAGQDFKVFGSPKAVSVVGKPAEFGFGEKDKEGFVKITVVGSPDSTNANFINLKITAWETRKVKEGGKSALKQVKFIDQISKAKPGGTVIAGERLYKNRDIMVTVKAVYQK